MTTASRKKGAGARDRTQTPKVGRKTARKKEPVRTASNAEANKKKARAAKASKKGRVTAKRVNRPPTLGGAALQDYWARVETLLESQYHGARERHPGDAGTRGDQGELDWASFLRSWLPPKYRVRTKGRIVGRPSRRCKDGVSGQMDVVILHPDYPVALEDERLWFAEGVVAAFECKACLRPAQITSALETAQDLSEISGGFVAEKPKDWVQRPLLFGLLAHTYVDAKNSIRSIVRALAKKPPTHARNMLDVLCIADLCYWSSSKTFLNGQDSHPSGVVRASYMLHKVKSVDRTPIRQSNVGRLVAGIHRFLAYDDPASSGLGRIFRRANPPGASGPSWEVQPLPEFLVQHYRGPFIEAYRKHRPGRAYPPGWETHYSY